jgi:NADH:ubiquinone oxidoreductase subunit C
MDIRERIKERLGDKILDWKEPSARRIYFAINKANIFGVARLLFKELGLRFSTASGTDTPAGLEIVYHFMYDPAGEVYSIKTMLEDRKHPEIDSITPIFSGAEWIEREIWEMLGINFKNHPNLKRLLLAEDWPQGDFPLRNEHES